MFLELIAVIFAGLAGGGLAHLAGRLSGRFAGIAPPRWSVPVVAGATMLLASITSEYSWYGRTVQNLPEGITVAQSIESRAPWRPWTYVVPMTNRFVAVDLDHLRENGDQEALYLADLYFFGRWKPVTAVEVMIDCDGLRRADPALGDGAQPLWREVGGQDPVVATVCAGA